MNFLKENMFLVVTAAVVLVGGAVLLLLANSEAGQADTGGKTYASVGGQINSLAPSGVNRAIVEAAERRVGGMRNEAKKVADEFLLCNSRGYEVMSFDISGQTIPAFPVDPKFKEDRETLRLLFPEKYRLRIEALCQTLKPTVPPTEAEIRDEIARIAASTMPLKKDELPKPTTPRTSERRVGERGERFHRPGGMEGGMRPAAGRTAGTSTPGNAVEQQALNSLVIGKSEDGWIYVDKEQQRPTSDRRSDSAGGAMYMVLSGTKTDCTDEILWLAHVGMWVQQDIVGAINLTNSQMERTASGGQRGVAASAVKRLMNIDVRGYVLRNGGGKAAALHYLDLGEKKVSKPVPQLTGRACNKLYDVIHYDFTVILPMRHLLRLQKNLMAQNYHTVLAVSITRPVQSDVYYYGTDSVMKVTIVGEMLMLTDWTRGRWDKDAKEWDKNCPPLIPVEFLKEMKNIDAGAMRKEDDKRPGMKTAGKTGSKNIGRGGGGERGM